MNEKTSVVTIGGATKRLIVVRYFLDRAGYDDKNSSSRFWNDCPAVVSAKDIATFLDVHGIKAHDDSSMLVEIYLDKFDAYMSLDICAEYSVQCDFSSATADSPGRINLRLTDLSNVPAAAPLETTSKKSQQCSTIPVGLFAFSMTIALESLDIFRKLYGYPADDAYLLSYSLYAFFISGLLQLIVGLCEVWRNNVHGATAFLGFGCFWLANGSHFVLTTYFPDQISESLLGGSNTLGTCVREGMVALFTIGLLRQTFNMNKVSTALTITLAIYVISGSIAPWNESFLFMKMTVGIFLAMFAYAAYWFELTNEVHEREVFNLFPWHPSSTETERPATLQQKAIELRTAGYPSRLVIDKRTIDHLFSILDSRLCSVMCVMSEMRTVRADIEVRSVPISDITNRDKTTMASNETTVIIVPSATKSLIVVRYYLDRPGYDLHNSSTRFWKDPPARVTAEHVADFLDQHGIKAKGDNGILVEIFLDRFGSFMWLDVCSENSVQFDFSSATTEKPGVMNIRLTDLSDTSDSKARNTTAAPTGQRCNMSPLGLFAFSFTVCLENVNTLRILVEGSIDQSYFLVWSPYAFFVSGLLQVIVGLNEIRRNNVYGATAFLAFGCFWLANGTKLILTSYFPEDIPDDFVGGGQVETLVRELWILLFACALFKQTLAMNKLTSALVGILIAYIGAACLAPWLNSFVWIKLATGFVLSLFAFFLFYAEFTNEVYHRKVYDLYPWSETNTEEVFGAAGRSNTLQHKAVNLRTAGHCGSSSLKPSSAFQTRAAVRTGEVKLNVS